MENRKIENIEYSKKFLKSLTKLPERIIQQAEKKENFLKKLF